MTCPSSNPFRPDPYEKGWQNHRRFLVLCLFFNRVCRHYLYHIVWSDKNGLFINFLFGKWKNMKNKMNRDLSRPVSSGQLSSELLSMTHVRITGKFRSFTTNDVNNEWEAIWQLAMRVSLGSGVTVLSLLSFSMSLLGVFFLDFKNMSVRTSQSRALVVRRKKWNW